MRIFADKTLSARLEDLAADEMRRFVTTSLALEPDCDAAVLEIAGGAAAYLGVGSPVNQAIGLGGRCPVTSADITALESFYSERGHRGLLVASPLSDPSLFLALAERGWVVEGFENVLVREYREGDDFSVTKSEIEVVEADDDESRAVWAMIAAAAFAAPLEPPPAQLALARIVAARPGATLMLAFIDGVPAGTGELFIDGDIAWLSADATLPGFRRRGVQSALQAARLELGRRKGCTLAVSEAMPGSGSQRNMERFGFRLAYTRMDFLAPKTQGCQGTERPQMQVPRAARGDGR